MIRFFYFFLLTLSCSCKIEEKPEKEEDLIRTQFRIVITVTNTFSGKSSEYILNDWLTQNHTASDRVYNKLNPEIFYYVRYSRPDYPEPGKAFLVPLDTTKIPFSVERSDSLFLLTQNFFRNIPITNYEKTVNGVLRKGFFYDDSHATVELSTFGRKMHATIWGISSPDMSTKEFDTLLKFVRRVSEDKKVKE